MSSYSREPKAVQFVAHDKDSKSSFPFIFHEQILRDILNNEEVANLPIALYSVAGKYRTGKSFLLNLFIHLLYSGTLNHKNLDLKDTTFGFKWKGGQDTITDGLWILDKPFILQKTNGKKVALFLMDTEGTHEPNKSQEIFDAIFSISTLLSSFQIFNIKHPITEEELRKLELIASLGEHFTKKSGYLEEKKPIIAGVKNFSNKVWQYGRTEMGETERGQQLKQKHNAHQSTRKVYPFQTLLFLIRDYPKSSIKKHKSTSECGMKVLEDILNEDKSTADEVRRVRKNVKSAFESTKCFVLRNPGEEVFDSDEDLECLPVGDVNKDFLSQVEELFHLYFNVENIVIKKINGKPVTCSELFKYSQKILKVYEFGEVPQVANIIEATDDTIMTKAIETGKEYYERELFTKCGTKYMNEANLKKIHEECKQEVMTSIENVDCFGSEEHKQKHIKKFEGEIEKFWEMKKMENYLRKKQKEKDSKITSEIHSFYKNSMIKRINGAYNTSDQIEEFHEESMKRSLKFAKAELGPNFDEYKNALTDYFEFVKVGFNISNENFKKEAETKFKQKLKQCYEYYNSNMKEKIKLQYLTDCELQKKHLKCKADAVREFNKIRNEVVGPEEKFHEIKSLLEKQIDERLKLFLDENEDYKANEDQIEERAWNNAILKFKYEIKKAMNENKRKKNDKVEVEYLKFVQSLVEEYRNDVAPRYKKKEESLRNIFQSIYDEEEGCIIL